MRIVPIFGNTFVFFVAAEIEKFEFFAAKLCKLLLAAAAAAAAFRTK